MFLLIFLMGVRYGFGTLFSVGKFLELAYEETIHVVNMRVNTLAKGH